MAWKKLEVERVVLEDPLVVIFRMQGVLTDIPEAFKFLDQVRDDLRHLKRPIILDLSEVEHVSSGGVGLLAASYTSAKEAGIGISMVGASKQAQVVLRLVGLLEVFRHYSTEEEALAQFPSEE